MFRTKLGFLFGAALAIAAAQVAGDTPGVTVDVGGAALLHRAPVRLPIAAGVNGIKGTVSLEVTLDAAGSVSDAHVLSGPEQLRKAALESVLQWHFAHETEGARRQVSITFDPPAGGTPAEYQGRQHTVATVTAPDDVAARRLAEEKLRMLQSQVEQLQNPQQRAAALEALA